MLICKIGFEHLLNGLNCQDSGLDDGLRRCVVDGCSEGTNSEVGAKLFIHLFMQGIEIPTIFDKLTTIFSNYEDVRNHLLFTILLLEETDAAFIVRECGDGCIILQHHDNSLEYQTIDYQGTPPYYAYNYIEKEHLSLYKDGVSFNSYRFDKTEFKAVGIATDGLSYLLESTFKDQFETLLVGRNVVAIKRLINIHHNYQFAVNTFPLNVAKQYIPFNYETNRNNLKDDLTIVI